MKCYFNIKKIKILLKYILNIVRNFNPSCPDEFPKVCSFTAHTMILIQDLTLVPFVCVTQVSSSKTGVKNPPVKRRMAGLG